MIYQMTELHEIIKRMIQVGEKHGFICQYMQDEFNLEPAETDEMIREMEDEGEI